VYVNISYANHGFVQRYVNCGFLKKFENFIVQQMRKEDYSTKNAPT
jgi:hypothetical protein